MNATCPWCNAPRDAGPNCPGCGANYAKAEAIKAHGKAAVAPTAIPAPAAAAESLDLPLEDAESAPNDWQHVDDAELEWKFCVFVIPAALLVSLLVYASGIGAVLQRMLFAMPLHELGHASFAWLCGYSAIPTVWKTLVPDTRGFIAPVVLLAAFGYLGWRGWVAENKLVIGAACGLALLQLLFTFGISLKSARMLVVFGGDGGGIILATVLMGTFFFGKATQLYKGSLRWGFVVIGASAFVDMFGTWVRARRDLDAIPLGSQDGQDADPLVLVQEYGWTLDGMVSRYLALGLLCLVALACVYAYGLRRAAREREARRVSAQLRERIAARPARG